MNFGPGESSNLSQQTVAVTAAIADTILNLSANAEITLEYFSEITAKIAACANSAKFPPTECRIFQDLAKWIEAMQTAFQTLSKKQEQISDDISSKISNAEINLNERTKLVQETGLSSTQALRQCIDDLRLHINNKFVQVSNSCIQYESQILELTKINNQALHDLATAKNQINQQQKEAETTRFQIEQQRAEMETTKAQLENQRTESEKFHKKFCDIEAQFSEYVYPATQQMQESVKLTCSRLGSFVQSLEELERLENLNAARIGQFEAKVMQLSTTQKSKYHLTRTLMAEADNKTVINEQISQMADKQLLDLIMETDKELTNTKVTFNAKMQDTVAFCREPAIHISKVTDRVNKLEIFNKTDHSKLQQQLQTLEEKVTAAERYSRTSAETLIRLLVVVLNQVRVAELKHTGESQKLQALHHLGSLVLSSSLENCLDALLAE